MKKTISKAEFITASILAIGLTLFVLLVVYDRLSKTKQTDNLNLRSYWISAEEQCEDLAKKKGYSHYALSGLNVDYFLGIITTCNVSKKPYGTPEDAFSIRIEMTKNMQFKKAKN